MASLVAALEPYCYSIIGCTYNPALACALEPLLEFDYLPVKV